METRMVVLGLLVLSTLSLHSQRRQSINLDVLDATLLGSSIAYELPLGRESAFALRAGLGLGWCLNLYDGDDVGQYGLLSVPVELNCLLFKKRGHLELAVGGALFCNRESRRDGDAVGKATEALGAFYTRVGYRHEYRSRMQLRFGISPTYGFFGDGNAADWMVFMPYVGIGYRF